MTRNVLMFPQCFRT